MFLCFLNNNLITKNWTKLGSITGNNKSDTTVLLSDYAQNYSLIVLYGIYDKQIMDALVLNPTIARAKNFLNYNEGDFICRAGISVVDNTVFASTQWLTFTAVDVYAIK